MADDRARRFGWRRLQAIAAAVTVAAVVGPMVIAGQVAGFLLAMAAPFVVGLALMRFLPRVAAVLLGVVAAATLAFSALYTTQALSHPEAAVEFIPQVFFVLSLAIAAVAAIPAYREVRHDAVSRKPRFIAVGTAVVIAVACALSGAAAAGVRSVGALPGDQAVVTRDFAFAPAKLTVEAGAISVHLTNEDTARHTFTIDGVADLSVPPNSTQRVTFEATPGTYRFYCRPHAAAMDGVLVAK